MTAITIRKQWNSSSQFLVSAVSPAGEHLRLLGTVYAPRGRRWATLIESQPDHRSDVVGFAQGVDAGAQILLQRFNEGLNARYPSPALA